MQLVKSNNNRRSRFHLVKLHIWPMVHTSNVWHLLGLSTLVDLTCWVW
jgi:hypothetical protein